MEIQVRTTHDLDAGSALADHARRRLLYVLMHRRHQIDRVEVRLGETRSRRGLGEGYCLVRVSLEDRPAVTVVNGGADLFDAIDRAVDEAGRLASEQLRAVRLGEQPARPHRLYA